MGAYLSEPNTQKESVDEDNDKLSYGASSMQGWRLDQEDAHNSILNFDERTATSFFAVYDGHGGAEVAAFCAKYLPDYLKKIDEYAKGNMEDALRKLFLKFDEYLLSEQAQKELKEMRETVSRKGSVKNDDHKEEKIGEEEEEEDDDEDDAVEKKAEADEEEDDDEEEEDDEKEKDETAILYDEATMPLEEVLKRYASTEKKVKSALKKKGVGVKPSSSSSTNAATAASSSSSASNKNKKKQPQKSKKDKQQLHFNEQNDLKALARPITSAEFQQQEELDINEIKMNSNIDATGANATQNNHDQDYDEASNLGEITDSQKSSLTGFESQHDEALSKSTTSVSNSVSEAGPKSGAKSANASLSATSSTVDLIQASIKSTTATSGVASAGSSSASNNEPVSSSTSSKTKLSKEELLKLSPIRKKSLSSSSLLDDLVGDKTTSAPTAADEENKENTNNNSNSNGSDLNKSSATPTNATASSSEENSNDAQVNANAPAATATETAAKSEPSKKKKLLKSSNLIAKFIADCVNTKLKQAVGKSKSAKSAKQKKPIETVAEVDDEEEKDEDYEGKNGKDNGEDDDDDDATEEEEDNDDEDDDEDDDDDDDDDDDEDEDEDDDEDYEEEDDEEEEEEEDEEDEEYEFDSNQPFGADARPAYDSGCTAVVALLHQNKQLYVANAGDSRCVVCRDGKAVDMSFDHKPEDEPERERIVKAGGTVTKDGRVNNGLNLSRAIGDHSYKGNKSLPLSEQMITSLPDLKTLDIDPSRDKFMVLACDGIWNFMSSQEVCDYISERLTANYSKLSQICEELFMHCLAPDSEGDGTGCDNMTCIIVTFNPFRQHVIKLNNINEEKVCLKRSLVEINASPVEQNGSTTHPATASSSVNANDEASLNKKLKQDEILNSNAQPAS